MFSRIKIGVASSMGRIGTLILQSCIHDPEAESELERVRIHELDPPQTRKARLIRFSPQVLIELELWL